MEMKWWVIGTTKKTSLKYNREDINVTNMICSKQEAYITTSNSKENETLMSPGVMDK
jgi:hypothetical protein